MRKIILGLGGIFSAVISVIAFWNNNWEGGLIFLAGAALCALVYWDWRE